MVTGGLGVVMMVCDSILIKDELREIGLFFCKISLPNDNDAMLWKRCDLEPNLIRAALGFRLFCHEIGCIQH